MNYLQENETDELIVSYLLDNGFERNKELIWIHPKIDIGFNLDHFGWSALVLVKPSIQSPIKNYVIATQLSAKDVSDLFRMKCHHSKTANEMYHHVKTKDVFLAVTVWELNHIMHALKKFSEISEGNPDAAECVNIYNKLHDIYPWESENFG